MKRSGDDFGGLYQVDTRNGFGLRSRNLNSNAFNITRTEVSKKLKTDISSNVSTDITTISAMVEAFQPTKPPAKQSTSLSASHSSILRPSKLNGNVSQTGRQNG